MQATMYIFFINCWSLYSHPLGDDRVARSARPLRVGNLRPAIVLYDEAHPLGDDIATIQTNDLSKRPDLLIIMGTSLKVHGLKKLVKEFAKAVKQGSSASTMNPKVIFVNKTAPAAEWSSIIDTHVEGTTDEWVERVTADWKHSRPVDWESQPTLREIMVTKTERTLSPKTTSDTKPTRPKAKGTRLCPFLCTIVLTSISYQACRFQ